ncbi:MAG: preprotein translocase subunit SecA [Pedosphaera sp.]|nr:preprotein translocase subunit SecA [Pedosphaera sp.]
MLGLLKKLFGTKNDREVRRLREQLVPEVNRIEAGLQSLPDEALRDKTAAWKAHLSAIQDDAQLARELETILPEVFAVVKNACRRLCGRTITVRGHPLEWNMVPFDVQLIGGYALHSRRIAEMATGEGKTLVATLPVYLNAITGRGVHVVTVNDYLAARDSEWMGAVYTFLGLTVGCIQNDQPSDFRRQQYRCDVTYGTNSEFGFDYLRDNGMADRREDQVQRGHYYAIVDEVDSILIDEARTPLIISGPAVVNADNKLYAELKSLVESLVRRQQRLCDDLLGEAETLLGAQPRNGSIDAGVESEIGHLLYKARLGQPKSPRLMRLLEDPANLRRLNTAELDLHKDQTKKELYDAKEALLFAIEEKSHEADLTEKGRGFLSPTDPDAFMLPDLATAFHEVDQQANLDAAGRLAEKQQVQQQFEARAERIHVISQLLKAFCLYEVDQQYIIEDNKVIIVDEHTGRKMPGRRWSDGLHQAVEAKEGVEVERETQTYATITIQNYFRLYHKLAGMTGTAETEANEFFDIYKLGVLVIPTNKPCLRKDGDDSVYKTKREKFKAVLGEIRTTHAQGRPILVGTASVESSESLSRMLKKESIVHSVLNAKYHQQEAEIVARAGQRGSLTIATNMAGRGTDIKLGPSIAELGGLHVLGTERHEARRTDRQLRGRCARQGDPGSSHFFLSLEDDVMRLYGGDRMVKMMEKMGLEEDQELTHPILNRSIETAQKRVEEHHFQARKRTLEYDDVMNKQREILYGFRNKIIHGEEVREHLLDIMEEIVILKVEQFLPTDMGDEGWNLRGLADWTNLNFPIGITEDGLRRTAEEGTETPIAGSVFDGLSPQQLILCRTLCAKVTEAYKIKVQHDDPVAITSVERYTMLSAIDRLWREHLYAMDGLRNSIGLRAYGQQDPLIEYKREAKQMFDELMAHIKTEICHNIFRSASSVEAYMNFLRSLPAVAHHDSSSGSSGAAPTLEQDEVSELNDAVSRAKPIRVGPKVGRNDPCPCGSGKKYKQCCGR